MQDWSNEKDKPGRPAAAFGRRSASNGQHAPAPAAPAAVPLPAAPAASPHPAPAPPRVPLSTLPPLPGQPVKAAASQTPPLPLSSQQLQLFTGPMGKRAAAQAPAVAPAPDEPPYDPPPLMPPPTVEELEQSPPPPPRGSRKKIIAIVSGALFGLVGGTIVVEAGRMVGAANRTTPMALDGPASASPWKRYAGWPAGDNKQFTNASAVRSPAKPKAPRKIPTPVQGDAAKGAELTLTGRGAANCLACHVVGDRGTNLPGNVGPDLSEIAKRGHTDEYLFNYIYDPRAYNADTVMPPWGSHGVLKDDEIRDIVAYLKTLASPARFKNPLDDPNKRPVPKEDRDNLDPMVNPGMWVIDKAKELWTAKGPTGASCAACHHTPEPEVRFKAWAASMPRWDKKLEKVLGVEEFVYRHAKVTTGHAWLMSSDDNTNMATYLRNLANGATIAVDLTSSEAKDAWQRGKEIMDRKMGRLNFACADCHTAQKAANRWVRGQWLTDAKGYTVHFPTWRTSRSQMWDIRKRFQWCNVAIGANELPPDANEYGDLELYLTSLSNGLKLSVPGIRP
jgi:L-cysteine S-thiosulfotransferase